jgi:hypothetical protein
MCKNICMISVIILLLFSICESQIFSEFGVKIGMISSKYEQDLMIPYPYTSNTIKFFGENRIGSTMGFFVRYLDSDIFNLESELYYLEKGGGGKIPITTMATPEGTGEYISTDIQFDFLRFQTGIRPYFSFNMLKPYLVLGGTIDYLLGVRNGYKPDGDFKSIVLGYSIGLGVEINKLLNIPIFIEFCFNSDLTNIYDSDELEVMINSYQVRLGFVCN